MKRILFYSSSLNNHLKHHTWDESIVVGFFDIEVQKLLPILGYAYKMNPILIHIDPLTSISNLDAIYNLDLFLYINHKSDLIGKEIVGIIYNCVSL